MEWKEIDEARYDEMLGMLPPVSTPGRNGFLMGECWTHNAQGQPMFAAFVKVGGKFYECLEPMTIGMFMALNLNAQMHESGFRLVERGAR